jgi:hypothetical protein
LERERAARARIEAGLASRHVRPEQKAALKEALKGAKLTAAISRYNDPESTAYAAEVTLALSDAGIEVREGSTIISANSSASGLFVEEAADNRLINALFLAGLATQKISSQKNDMLQTGQGLNTILVGLKPNLF